MDSFRVQATGIAHEIKPDRRIRQGYKLRITIWPATETNLSLPDDK